jgi:hypothetical protein
MQLELMECLVSYPGSFGKISPGRRGNSPQAQITDCSARFKVFIRTSSHFPLKEFPMTPFLSDPSRVRKRIRPKNCVFKGAKIGPFPH